MSVEVKRSELWVIVRVSPKRFIIAERDNPHSSFFRAITKKIATRWEAQQVLDEIANLDTSYYNNLTNSVLLDTHEELE